MLFISILNNLRVLFNYKTTETYNKSTSHVSFFFGHSNIDFFFQFFDFVRSEIYTSGKIKKTYSIINDNIWINVSKGILSILQMIM